MTFSISRSDISSVENAECGVQSAGCGKCGVWKMQSLENAGCGKCGMWKMRSAENVEHFNFNMKLTNDLINNLYILIERVFYNIVTLSC